MRFRRVLLVNPEHRVEWPGLTPPIGLGYLAETLRNEEIEYDILDMNLHPGLQDLRRKMDIFKPDLVGMTMITRDYRAFYGTLEKIREYDKRVKIVAGGAHVTILKEQVLEDCGAIDYGVTHDGERTLIDLCRGELGEENINGLLYRHGGRIICTPNRENIANLDQHPWPRFEKFELDRYFKEISLYTSRGCPYHCIFCARHVLSPQYRARSAVNVGDELEFWYQNGYRKFNIEDDNFNLIQERVYAICDEIERRQLKGITLRCSNGLRADRIDKAILTRMREVGFAYLAFGVDAGNDRMLNVVKKGESMAQIENAIDLACQLGYTIKLFFIVGNPSEKPTDVEDMVKLSRKYPVQEVHFNNVVPYPGTELFAWIGEHNYFLRKPEEYLNNATFWEKQPIFETPELPASERIRLTKYLDTVRMEVHRKAIGRMFDKYGLLGRLAGRLLSNKWLEQVYYRSIFCRGLIERFRYQLTS